ncbi:hypothetical protein MTO96_045018 [Rhipicephalus appendiculatus]
MKEEERTSPAPAVLDERRDALNDNFNMDPETPYDTPDEMATEEPATPAKRCRRDATTVNATAEETLVDSAQRLEPQWMVVRSTRARKGTHAPVKRSASLTREGAGDAGTNATGVAGARSSCRADGEARFVKVANCWLYRWPTLAILNEYVGCSIARRNAQR